MSPSFASPPTDRPPSAEESPSEAVEYQRGGWKELLRNRRFLLMEASGTLAGAGYAVYSVSVLYLAYGLTGNLLIAGTVLFIETGVYTATFLVAPLVDRARDKRTILVICYPIQAVAAAALALELRSGVLSIPILLGLVLLLAILWDFVWAVFMVAPRIVLPKRQLYVANGFSSIVSVGTQIGGYAGGGALLYFIGPYGGASAYAVLLVAALAAAIPLALPVDRAPITRFWETFRRGWDTFRGHAGRSLRTFAAVETFLGFFSAIPPLLITAIAYQEFSHPAAAYGVLVTALALGGSVAGVGIGHLNPRRHVGPLLVVTPVLAGACVIALAPFVLEVWVVAILLGGVGAAFSAHYTAKYSWVQGSYPPEMLGRLSANLYLFTGISGSVAVLLVGSLSPGVSLGTLELVVGLGLVTAGLIALASPFIRRMSF